MCSSGLTFALLVVLWPADPSLGTANAFFTPFLPKTDLSKQQVEIVISRCKHDTSWLLEMGYADITTSYDRCDGAGHDAPGPGEHVTMPNTGREAGMYLSHIVDNYDDLAEWTVFTQGEKPNWTTDTNHKGRANMFQGQRFDDFVHAHASRHERPRYFTFTSVVNINDPPPRSLYLSSRTEIVGGEDEQPQMCFDKSGDWSLLPTSFTNMVEELQAWQHASIGSQFDAKMIPSLFDISPAYGTLYFAQGATFAASREAIRSRPKAYYSKLADMIGESSDPWIAYYLDWSWHYVIGGEDAPCGTEKYIMESTQGLSFSSVADCSTCTDGHFLNAAGYDCQAMRVLVGGGSAHWQGMDGELAGEACVHFACHDCGINKVATVPVLRRSGSGSGSGSGPASSAPTAAPSRAPTGAQTGTPTGYGSGSGSGYTSSSPKTLAPTSFPITVPTTAAPTTAAPTTAAPTTAAPTTAAPTTAAPTTAAPTANGDAGWRVSQSCQFASITSSEYAASQTMREAYEKGYAWGLGILTIVAGSAIYSSGCYVSSSVARRSATVTFDAFVPTSSGITVSSNGVDATSLSTGISTVVSGDSTYSSVSVPSSDSIQVLSTTVTILNSENDSGSDHDVILLSCISGGCGVVLAMIGIVLYKWYHRRKTTAERRQMQAWAGIRTNDFHDGLSHWDDQAEVERFDDSEPRVAPV